MTDFVRAQVRQEMARQHITQRELADRLGLHPQSVWDILNGKTSNIPARWLRVLDELGLELVVRPKQEPEE